MVRLGQRLYNTRVNKSLTIEQIAAATKIRPKFLAAIERGEYEQLPSSSYAQGFVRNYASYLGLSQKEILALFRREFDEKKYVKVLPDGLTKNEGFAIRRIHIKRSVIALVLFVIIIAGYLGYQYRSMYLPPPLSIDPPKANTQSKDDVVISGKSDPNATVFVNNESVTVNAKGEFSKSLSLFPGKSSITIKAKNRFGNETVLQKIINIKS